MTLLIVTWLIPDYRPFLLQWGGHIPAAPHPPFIPLRSELILLSFWALVSVTLPRHLVPTSCSSALTRGSALHAFVDSTHI